LFDLPTAAPPSAADITASIFATGRKILKAADVADRQAGSIIGRWRKLYSDSVVLTVLARCQSEQPSEPVEWITRALQFEARRAAGQQSPSQPPTRRSLVEIARGVAAELADDQVPRLAAN
jgi:hypothetical protein